MIDIRSADVNRLDFLVLEHRIQVVGGDGNIERGGELIRLVLAAGDNGGHFHVAQPAHTLSVHLAHESCSDDCGFDDAHWRTLKSFPREKLMAWKAKQRDHRMTTALFGKMARPSQFPW